MSIRISLLALLAFLLLIPERAETGEVTASWYGSELAGNPTASGEPFNPMGHTAASKTLPLGTQLRVCKERCTSVRVNDRGPFVAGRDLDLSEGAAKEIGLEDVGTVTISEQSSKPLTELPSTGGSNESGGLTPPYSLSYTKDYSGSLTRESTGSPLFLGFAGNKKASPEREAGIGGVR